VREIVNMLKALLILVRPAKGPDVKPLKIRKKR